MADAQIILDNTPPPMQRGHYRHYKGNDYDVIDVVRHSESHEWHVLYRPRYGERFLWVRPYAMFFENVVIAGETKPRFAFVDPA